MNRGFTLIELSIVLVVIGLSIGAVLVGQDLIRAATDKKIVTQARRYLTAVHAFQLKYDELPGDMSNASTVINNTLVNGNHNGCIDYSIGGQNESVNAFSHLSYAGFIEGYSPNPSGSTAIFGQNMPLGPVSNSGYLLAPDNDQGATPSTPDCYIFQYVVWYLGVDNFDPTKPNSYSGNNRYNEYYSYGGIVSGVDAFRIDTKFDDGLVFTGSIRGYFRDGLPPCNYGSPDPYHNQDTKQCYYLLFTN